MWFDPYTTATHQRISVAWRSLPLPVRGLYFRSMVFPIVILHNAMTPIEEKCVFTEELGHHFLSVGNYVGPVYSLVDRMMVNKEERRVMRWVTDRLINDREFVKLVRKGVTVHDMAEHFEVTTRLVRAKYEFMRLSLAIG